MTYLDSSAIVRLVVAEPGSEALRRELAACRERAASSMLARVEVLRAVRRAGSGTSALVQAHAVLRGLALVAVDEPVLRAAGALEPTGLRSLDAIHLATALSLPGRVPVFTYDHRLREAARAAGLEVLAPD